MGPSEQGEENLDAKKTEQGESENSRGPPEALTTSSHDNTGSLHKELTSLLHSQQQNLEIFREEIQKELEELWAWMLPCINDMHMR